MSSTHTICANFLLLLHRYSVFNPSPSTASKYVHILSSGYLKMVAGNQVPPTPSQNQALPHMNYDLYLRVSRILQHILSLYNIMQFEGVYNSNVIAT